MIIRLLLYITALAEAGMLPYMFVHELPREWWIEACGVHVLLSSLIGVLGRAGLPSRYRHPIVMSLVFLTGLALFVPMVGGIAVATLVWATTHFAPAAATQDIQGLDDQRHVGVGHTEHRTAGGNLPARLSSAHVNTESRLEALGRLQGFDAHQVSMMVKGALQDQTDDIRLVAFGILDKKEKAINARINQDLELFHTAEDISHKVRAARHLAYGYWELMYKQIVDGDILAYVREQATTFNEFVLEHEPTDAGMWALNGQLHIHGHDLEQARESLTNALECGIPESRVIPYLAELVFRQHDYVALPQLFADSPGLKEVAVLNPIVRYWTQATPARRIQSEAASGAVHG